MAVHVALLLYISVIGTLIFLTKPYSKNKNRTFLVMAFAAIWLVQSLRGTNVGLDTDQYTYAFNNAKIGYFPLKWEFLFGLLIRLSVMLSDSPQIMFAIASLIILTGIFVFIDQNLPDNMSKFWAVFFFVVFTQYFSTMNLLRQSLAMSFGCNIYTVFNKCHTRRKYVLSAILLIIAQMFHSSGFVCVLLIFPFIFEADRKMIFLCMFMAVASYFLYGFALGIFLRVAPRYARYIGGRLDAAGQSGVYTLFALIDTIIIVLSLIYFDPHKEKNLNIYRLLFVISYSVALIILQRKISLAMRLGYYFELFMILLIPEFINRFEIHTRVPVKFAAYMLGWAYFIYSMTASNARGCVPYTFFWQ